MKKILIYIVISIIVVVVIFVFLSKNKKSYIIENPSAGKVIDMCYQYSKETSTQ